MLRFCSNSLGVTILVEKGDPLDVKFSYFFTNSRSTHVASWHTDSHRIRFSVQDLAYQKDAFAQPPHLGNHDGHVQDHFACPPTIIDL